MTRRNVIFVAVLTLFLVFCLSVVWEFTFRETLLSLVEEGPLESAETHWKYIFTSVSFVAIALFISSLVALKIVGDRERVGDALGKSEMKFKDFATDVAHELRTPLSVLKLHVDDLDDNEAAQNLRDDVAVMSRMLEQLLAVTRLDASETLAMNDLDIRKVCTDVAERLAPIAIRDERFIEVIGVQQAVFIKGNVDAMEHAVRNLVENAMKYSSRQTTVTIEVTNEPSISVINEGIAIPDDKRDAIFERFLRSDRRSSGAGLGLSIVKRAVDAHKGSIDVTNAPGGDGTKFTIHLAPIH